MKEKTETCKGRKKKMESILTLVPFFLDGAGRWLCRGAVSVKKRRNTTDTTGSEQILYYHFCNTIPVLSVQCNGNAASGFLRWFLLQYLRKENYLADMGNETDSFSFQTEERKCGSGIILYERIPALYADQLSVVEGASSLSVTFVDDETYELFCAVMCRYRFSSA